MNIRIYGRDSPVQGFYLCLIAFAALKDGLDDDRACGQVRIAVFEADLVAADGADRSRLPPRALAGTAVL